MQKLFKGISIAVLCFSIVIFALVGYATFTIPDEFHITDENDLSSSEIFTLSISRNHVQQANVNAKEAANENYELNVKIFNTIPVKKSTVKLSQRKYVTVSGKIFGIRLFTEGVLVISMQAIETSEGERNPSKEAGIQQGDIVKKIAGQKVTSTSQVAERLNGSDGKEVEIVLERNGKEKTVKLKPVKSSKDGKYKAGLWVRDSTAGIGTMTFYDRETGIFAGLGHAVCDVDTGLEMPISSGDAVNAEIKGCYKGNSGTPGELCGVFSGGEMGTLCINGDTGIYGVLNKFDASAEELPVALSSEVHTGKAQILASVDENPPRYYDAEIVKVYSSSDNSNRNMIVKITDEELIEKTGGIVQGMSGTPLIQNGMLIGAITHVFVNDPLQGYGIYAENMIVTADDLEKTLALKKAS